MFLLSKKSKVYNIRDIINTTLSDKIFDLPANILTFKYLA